MASVVIFRGAGKFVSAWMRSGNHITVENVGLSVGGIPNVAYGMYSDPAEDSSDSDTDVSHHCPLST